MLQHNTHLRNLRNLRIDFERPESSNAKVAKKIEGREGVIFFRVAGIPETPKQLHLRNL